MTRTVHQIAAYCEHALKSGMPVDEIIDTLINDGESENAARQGLITAMKRAKKPALVMISAGIVLASLGIGFGSLGLSAGFIYIWPFFPTIIGVVLVCIGANTFLAIPSMKSRKGQVGMSKGHQYDN